MKLALFAFGAFLQLSTAFAADCVQLNGSFARTVKDENGTSIELIAQVATKVENGVTLFRAGDEQDVFLAVDGKPHVVDSDGQKVTETLVCDATSITVRGTAEGEPGEAMLKYTLKSPNELELSGTGEGIDKISGVYTRK